MISTRVAGEVSLILLLVIAYQDFVFPHICRLLYARLTKLH